MKAIDSGRWLRASRHLDQVLELPALQWPAYVAEVRLSDPDTAAELETMLEDHRRVNAEGFLDSLPAMANAEPKLAGVSIGAYTLVSQIGQGGMGSVWLGTRSDGRYEGKVAIKLLNAALVGRAGEERFRREGTILARLAHPHIARLIDAGVSNTGQPYLVLELVEGRHIDAHCDDERLTVDDRLRLFLDVLSAVSHAHANLIVHRDLKPSNVLVDAAGRVKLLDFSIAKLIETDTLAAAVSRLTREGGAALTPKYAAPEQINSGVITTATDVYSLGVLLYELLSGQHPAGNAPRSPAEFVRAVTEVDAVRLSDAPIGAGEEGAILIASRRSTSLDRLRRRLEGDLETIVAKALKKDPAERYASVGELADDLKRYVDNQPISARPDSLGYRVRKFVRRHRTGITAAAAMAVVLVGLTAFYTWRLTAERDRAQLEAEKSARVSELLTSVLTTADPFRDPRATEPTMRNLLDAGAERVKAELGDQPELQVELYALIGRTYGRMGLFDKAMPLLEGAVSLGRRTFASDHVRMAQALNDLGVGRRNTGQPAAAEPLLAESLGMRRRLLGSMDKDVAVTLVELGRALRDQGKDDLAEAPIREALKIRLAVFGEEHRETATSKAELALWLFERGEVDQAVKLQRENVATSERVLGASHANVAAAKRNLGQMLLAQGGDAAGAESLLRDALEVTSRNFGESHAQYATALNSLSLAVEEQGRLDEARGLLERALAIAKATGAADSPRTLSILTNLGRVQVALGQARQAEPALRQVLAARQGSLPARDWRIGQSQSLLASSLFSQNRYAEAEPLMVAADGLLPDKAGIRAREKRANRDRLARLRAVRQD
jgi:serine/threonine protein kinase